MDRKLFIWSFYTNSQAIHTVGGSHFRILGEKEVSPAQLHPWSGSDRWPSDCIAFRTNASCAGQIHYWE